jgi:hypothetical protein
MGFFLLDTLYTPYYADFMSKARFLTSIRLERDSYFAASKLMPVLDGNLSYVLNKAIGYGLAVMGEDPVRRPDDSALASTVIQTQAARIIELERQVAAKAVTA